MQLSGRTVRVSVAQTTQTLTLHARTSSLMVMQETHNAGERQLYSLVIAYCCICVEAKGRSVIPAWSRW